MLAKVDSRRIERMLTVSLILATSTGTALAQAGRPAADLGGRRQ